MPPKRRSPAGSGHSHSQRNPIRVKTTRDAKYVKPATTPEFSRAEGIHDDIEWQNYDEDVNVPLTIDPTNTTNPSRPRTLAAGYSREHETLRLRFRDGAEYEYYQVPPSVWANFKRVKSPGRAVNRTLNNFEYKRVV